MKFWSQTCGGNRRFKPLRVDMRRRYARINLMLKICLDGKPFENACLNIIEHYAQ